MQSDVRKRGFVSEMMAQTFDGDFVKNSVRSVDTGTWLYRDGMYCIAEDTFRPYRPDNLVLVASRRPRAPDPTQTVVRDDLPALGGIAPSHAHHL